jgi:hypothetical protein
MALQKQEGRNEAVKLLKVKIGLTKIQVLMAGHGRGWPRGREGKMRNKAVKYLKTLESVRNRTKQTGQNKRHDRLGWPSPGNENGCQ